ncbi:class I SAM-dependent methyltransferase [Leptospira kanakyensis]|uniref:class I SAM-dependent methyltransferase n=1 Tax=Leptospira kanakyensis TaxID=2484968 RepID=UPI00223E62F8|nr:methyltransferase domain-containing protein [Leptospira kanakyensis]MCW7482123.1 class I SAM-dependent methyltransferase [Leptospira kanakyensis]
MRKINLGAGLDIISGWCNHDIAQLPGIDVVHDLNQRPWPWESSSVDEIKMYDVLEHLNDFIPSMEEIYRILKPGGHIILTVPYYNSWAVAADPTHKRGFHETSFYFFDPNSSYCKERYYYTNARFLIEEEVFILVPFNPYYVPFGLKEINVFRKLSKRIVGLIGNYFISNLIQDLKFKLKKPEIVSQ